MIVSSVNMVVSFVNMVVLRVENMFVSSIICLVSYEYVIYAEIPVSCELYVYWQWNWKETRGAFRSNHVSQPESNVWPNQKWHVDKPQRDTWTNLSATRGPFRARHVDKPQRDTWRCVKEPRHHIHVSTRLATSATSMGRATWHPLPWPISWPFGLVIEEIHFYDEKHVGHGKVPLLWPKWPIGHGRPNVTELLWPIQFDHK
jgi:hypothetical protein